MADDTTPHGAHSPGAFDAAVIAMTGGLPRNWLGLRLAIALRRLVTKRLHGDDPGLDVERWGLKLRLHPLKNGCEKGLLFTPQFYEAEERKHLARQIDRAVMAGRPFVFVDIGANVGLFSLFVAGRAGGQARILAIEPERENLRRLRFNLDANPGLSIRVLPHALGASAGTLAVEANRDDRGGTRTRPDDGSANAVRVPSKTLLQALNEESVTSIDALKIDVEGAEDTILMPFFQDAPQSLWPRFLVIEDTSGLWRVDVFAELKARGYREAGRSRQNVMMER
jgi:FkbM family methyltransferase